MSIFLNQEVHFRRMKAQIGTCMLVFSDGVPRASWYLHDWAPTPRSSFRQTATSSTGGVFGELLFTAWAEQLRRTLDGDRLYHSHQIPIENARLTMLSDVIERTVGATDLPLSTFRAPSVTVCAGDCLVAGEAEATLSDSYSVTWEVRSRTPGEEVGN